MPTVLAQRLGVGCSLGILAYLDTKMTNGPVEGINNKLRGIARRAYGFHSHGALISMLFRCCGGIELAPPLPTHIELRRLILIHQGSPLYRLDMTLT